MSVVLVSGASRGLGNALAAEYAARGDQVFCGVRSLDARVAGIPVELDVTDNDSVARAVDFVVATAGRIDLLINNAGVHLAGPLLSLEINAFKNILDVNVLGAWRLTRAARPYLTDGSTVAMISSLSGLVGPANDGAYATSKFALEGMSQSLASELGPEGVRVLVFEPSAVATGFAGATHGDPPATVASDIANVIASNDAPFRNPLGDVGRRVAETLRIDDGSRASALFASFSK
ncbi:SDR family NAD(P)-dependent oxidoreductase [Sphingomonas sp. ERG5]|uniref:SDR family NAD(P)-dependent oxidoreductase n=1 Tax=Sphingomonas sp. ERG5 TaxID=1381597 RepID=UPI0006911D94|nr:SDR family NAD(P)-dependent oxidoreductase [Sphingomonas sp. ERG5]